jgi:hypothetical protein
MDYRRLLRQKNIELEKLKASTNTNCPNEHSDDSDESEPIAKKMKTSDNDPDGLRTDALHAGKRFAVCNNLWVDPAAITHIASLTDSDAADPSEESIGLREQAEAILRSLPPSLHPYVGTKWFRKRVSTSHTIRYPEFRFYLTFFTVYGRPS